MALDSLVHGSTKKLRSVLDGVHSISGSFHKATTEKKGLLFPQPFLVVGSQDTRRDNVQSKGESVSQQRVEDVADPSMPGKGVELFSTSSGSLS
jgi:hypothetical protein